MASHVTQQPHASCDLPILPIMFSSIGDILALLALQDWETFRSTVLLNPDSFRKIASAVSACPELNGMTILHAAVRFNPPLDIVAQMIRLCPHMTADKDCLDRTPLHVAAGSKASASLLKLLAHACPAACDVQDEEGKTPLHFACDSSCVLFEEDHHENDESNTSKQPPNHESIAALLSYSIHAATLEDDEEMSPLEHAIMSGASLETVKLLQSATSKGMQLKEGSQSLLTATKGSRVQDDWTPLSANSKCKLSSRPHKKFQRITLADQEVSDYT